MVSHEFSVYVTVFRIPYSYCHTIPYC